jgi:hypothetical protein
MKAPLPLPSLERIAEAVSAWQCAHPLAEQLGPQSVHSIGLVALPFFRAPPASLQSQGRNWRRLFRAQPLRGGGSAAFNEAFLDHISATRAANFASRYGVEEVLGGDDWPKRRIDPSASRTGAFEAGWPYERWLATAALDGRRGRTRVLVSLAAGDSAPAVLGSRLLDRRRVSLALAGAGLLTLLALAKLLAPISLGAASSNPPASSQELRILGAVRPASGSAASAPSNGPSAAVAAPQPTPQPAQQPAQQPAPQPAPPQAPASAATPATKPSPTTGAASAPELRASAPTITTDANNPNVLGRPLIDIRPKLGRDDKQPRPPILGAKGGVPLAAGGASEPAKVGSPTQPPSEVAAALMGNISPTRKIPAGQRTVALVSQGYAKREEAQAMLNRMRQQVSIGMAVGTQLDGEVFESPQGFRAAVWPFASREEAQLVNATMIARGWRTRAVDF